MTSETREWLRLRRVLLSLQQQRILGFQRHHRSQVLVQVHRSNQGRSSIRCRHWYSFALLCSSLLFSLMMTPPNNGIETNAEPYCPRTSSNQDPKKVAVYLPCTNGRWAPGCISLAGRSDDVSVPSFNHNAF